MVINDLTARRELKLAASAEAAGFNRQRLT